MENFKHTKDYAESEAKKAYLGTNHSLSDIAAFTYGYIHAIEKTAAPELLEALMSTRMLNLHLYEEGTVGHRVYTEINNAINKATK